MEVAALDPAAGDAGLDEVVFYGLVGVYHETVGVWYVAAEEDAGHAFAGAVLDAVARVYYQRAGVLALLQQVDRAQLAAHVDDDVLGDGARVELLFAVNVDFAAAFAQLLGGDVENGGVVAYMVG